MKNESEKTTLEECASYFRKRTAYARLFNEMRRKYQKFGKLTGKIRLEGMTQEEKSALSEVLGRRILSDDFQLSVTELQAALNETKFQGAEVTELLRAYYRDDIITNSEKKEKEKESEKLFWHGLLEKVKGEYGSGAKTFLWLDEVRKQRRYGCQLILRLWKNPEENPEEIVLAVCRAAEYLQREGKNSVRLAVLGAGMTKNPHYFDSQNAAGRLLISALSFIWGMQEPKLREDILALYYRSGIRPDDISSFTTCYGIHFYTQKGEHQAYRHFIEENEKYVLTLSNLSRLTRADSLNKKVFVIENQMVFSQICDRLKGREYSLICTSGQMKVASLLLIDMLTEADCKLYYCGDTDPEGIEIADRMMARSFENIFLWRMEPEDYYRSVSDERISEISMKKLDKIEDARLKELCRALRKEKRAGYQEHLLALMVQDILDS